MPVVSGGGIHFREPWEFFPHLRNSNAYSIVDKAASNTTAAVAAFWTELALRGAIDTNDVVANTYVTLANITGKGFLGGVIGPTSGGNDITTFEITVDGGTAVELPITTASGKRAALLPSVLVNDGLTTAYEAWISAGDLNAGKTILSGDQTGWVIPAWNTIGFFGAPVLKFKTSLLVRIKHAASITNSTATAYKGAMYRVGLA